jgi:hypothetical protein
MKKWYFLLCLILEKQKLALNNSNSSTIHINNERKNMQKKNIDDKTHKIMTSNEKNRNLLG